MILIKGRKIVQQQTKVHAQRFVNSANKEYGQVQNWHRDRKYAWWLVIIPRLLISRTYNKSTKLNHQKNKLFNKWVTGLKKYFSREEQMTNKYVKSMIFLAAGNSDFMCLRFTIVKMAITRNTANADANVGEGPFHLVSMRAEISHCGSRWGSSSKN